MNKKLLFWMFALFFLVLTIQSVHAIDILDSVLQPFKGTDVGRIYDTYSLFIDAILYLLLFLGLAQLIYVKLYGAKEGKLVAVAVGLALTFAMALLESRTGFRLSGLMPIAAIILMFILFILLYSLFDGMFNDKGASFSLAFLIMYGFMMSTFSPLYKWLETNAPLLAAIVQIAMVISFIVLIIKLIGMFKGGGSTGGGGSGGGSSSTTPPKTPTPTEPNKITLTSPSNHQHFNAGDYVRIAFEVSGPDLMKNYDYEVRLDDGHFAARVPNVRGNQVWPFPTRAGTEIPAGRHALYAVAFRRGWISGGSNKIITQSNVIEINVGPGGGGGGGAPVTDLVNLITNNLEDAITRLAQAFIEYQRSFNAAITLNASGRAAAIDWATLIRNRQTLLDELGRVNDVLDAIYLHPSYGFLTPANLAVLAARVNRSNILRTGIIDYEIAAINDFNTGSMPSRPTP